MGQDRARATGGAAAGPGNETQRTLTEVLAERAARLGHTYRETPAGEILVDADCVCMGWSRWDALPNQARVSWRMHASLAIMSAEAKQVGS